MSCVHNMRLSSRHAVCLDVFYDNSVVKNIFKAKIDAPEIHRPLLEGEYDYDGSTDEGTAGNDPQTAAAIQYEKSTSRVKEDKGISWIYFCFFIGGISLNLAWGSISFIVSYWQIHYGDKIWPQFLLCYNLPGFPILLLQLYSDDFFSKLFGSQRVYVLRISLSFLALALFAGLVPFISGLSHVGILIYITGVGITVGAAHGWIYSLASLYPIKAVSYLVAGGGLSAIILLVLTIAEQLPPDPSFSRLLIYFEPVLVLSVIGIIFLVAMLFSKFSKTLFYEADKVQQTTGVSPASSEVSNDPSHDVKVLPSHIGPQPGHILKYIWSPLLSMFITVSLSAIATAKVTDIPSATNNMMFPAILLYISSISSFLGNEAAVYIKYLNKPTTLLVFSIFRSLFVPFLLVYSLAHFIPRNDYLIYVVVGLHAATSAFCVSKSYSVLSGSVNQERQASASNWLNISLYVGLYVGLGISFSF
eukprot:TRINITY_DN6508_c0_g1_i1.p1 TRINITY_DN6508_c0_g1~~TRINITY_DN6508_c0_g1_i1.p1  ORF type:complete len:474 (+),score=68.51 TRINITY_DN6508_c0_g1_i1:57-1478(+)